MTKAEWKKQFSAARMVRGGVYEINRGKYSSEAFKLANKNVWLMIESMFHRSIYEAIVCSEQCIYDISKSKWAIKHNSRCFPKENTRMTWYLKNGFDNGFFVKNKVFKSN